MSPRPTIPTRLSIAASKKTSRALRVAAAMAILCLIPCAANASAERDDSFAESILRRSMNASRTLNIRGTETVIVQSARGGMDTMTREVTRSKNGVTLTRWTGPASQKGLVILDDGAWSRCFDPTTGTTRVSRSAPRPRTDASAARLMRLILRNYRVEVEGTAPMAGRDCYILRLTPYHPISHTMRLWIDRRNGAVLSHMESTARGQTLTVASYNGVAFPSSVDISTLRKALPQAKETSFSRSAIIRNFDDVRRKIGFDFCPPYAMPAGYEFEHAEILSLKGATTTCLRYTDGIAEITICQSYSSEERPAGYISTRPIIDPMGNYAVDHRLGQMNFVLVGRCEMNGLLAITRVLDSQKERTYLGYISRNYRLPAETVFGLRNQGLGLDTLDALLAISSQRRQPLATLVSLTKQGYSWAALARRFQADAGRILKHVRSFQCH
jgi:negative regulator of sigma E activity